MLMFYFVLLRHVLCLYVNVKVMSKQGQGFLLKHANTQMQIYVKWDYVFAWKNEIVCHYSSTVLRIPHPDGGRSKNERCWVGNTQPYLIFAKKNTLSVRVQKWVMQIRHSFIRRRFWKCCKLVLSFCNKMDRLLPLPLSCQLRTLEILSLLIVNVSAYWHIIDWYIDII